MKTSLLLAAALATLLFASNASAAIIVTAGAGGGNPGENLHFNQPGLFTGPGLTIQGATNRSSYVLDITGGVSLIASPGLAAVSAQSGDPFGTTMFTPHSAIDLSGNLNSMSGFLDIKFNINASADGTIYFVVDYSDLDGSNPGSYQSPVFDLEADGENFFQIMTDAGEVIHMITLYPSGDIIDDIKQIRLSGVVTADGTIVILNNEVPEPSSLAIGSLVALGLAAVAAQRRRRAGRLGLKSRTSA